MSIEGDFLHNVLILDPGKFYNYLDEHSWFDGHEVALPKADRLILHDALNGGRRPMALTPARTGELRSAPGPGAEKVTNSGFPVEEGELDAFHQVDAPSLYRPNIHWRLVNVFYAC